MASAPPRGLVLVLFVLSVAGALPAQAAEDPPPVAQRPAKAGHAKKITGEVLIGAGSALLITSAVMGVSAALDSLNLDFGFGVLCSSTPGTWFYSPDCAAWMQQEAARRQQQMAANAAAESRDIAVSVVTGVAGVALLSAGIATCVIGGREAKRAARLARHVSLAPVLGRDHVSGATAMLRFQF